MPLKWKIFLGLNFVLSLPALVCFILLLIDTVNSYYRAHFEFVLFVFLFGLLVIAVNGFLNIYILQRFFPDKLLPRSIKSLNVVSLVLNIIACICLLIFCIYGAIEEFGEGRENGSQRGKFALFILSFMWIVQVTVLVMQAQLPRTVSRNNRESLHSLIDSIGEQ